VQIGREAPSFRTNLLSSIFTAGVEGEGRFLRNGATYVPNNMAAHHTRPECWMSTSNLMRIKLPHDVPEERSCEHGNYTSGFIKDKERL
jgi:hypothetical protein